MVVLPLIDGEGKNIKRFEGIWHKPTAAVAHGRDYAAAKVNDDEINCW